MLAPDHPQSPLTTVIPPLPCSLPNIPSLSVIIHPFPPPYIWGSAFSDPYRYLSSLSLFPLHHPVLFPFLSIFVVLYLLYFIFLFPSILVQCFPFSILSLTFLLPAFPCSSLHFSSHAYPFFLYHFLPLLPLPFLILHVYSLPLCTIAFPSQTRVSE